MLKFSRTSLWAAVLSCLVVMVACSDSGTEGTATPPVIDADQNADQNGTTVDEQGLKPAFELGQSWIVGSIYRSTSVKTPEDLIAPGVDIANADLAELEPLMPAEIVPSDSTNWTTPIFWEFGVINTGYTPEAGPFADLAKDLDGKVQPITIIKAVAPKELNTRSVVEGMDPVFYLVLRESDYRVTAVHYNYKVKSGRNTVVLEMPEAESGVKSPGSDIDYFIVDYLMPIFPMVMEDGSVDYGHAGANTKMDVTVVDADTADVTFTSAVDRRPVSQRWSAGEPWFDYSMTDGRRSWRLSTDDVNALLDLYGVEVVTNSQFLEPVQAITEKFRNPISMTSLFTLEVGEASGRTPDAHTAWAGYWFPLEDAGTLFGWSGGPSNRQLLTDGPATSLRADIDADLGAIDTLMNEIIDMDKDAPERNDKIKEYWELKEGVATRIRDHFEDPTDGVIAKLRDGRMSLDAIDSFGPLEKYALYLLSTKATDKPFEVVIWEFTKQYNPEGGSWWGKCNGWAAASVLLDEPREPVTLQLDLSNIVDGETGTVNMELETGDLKALAASLYYGTHSHFYGQRYYGEDDDRGSDYQDIYPDVFHRLISFYMGEEKYPMVFELTAGDQIWNYGCYGYDTEVGQRQTLDEGTRGINAVTAAVLEAEGKISAEAAEALFKRRSSSKGIFSDWDQVAETEGVTADDVQALRDANFSLHGERLAHRVSTSLHCATDGVSAWHVDAAVGQPTGFVKEYDYNLVVSDSGRLLGGEWLGDSIEDHPDFVWVPYANETRRADQQSREISRYGTYENYLNFIYNSRYAPNENPFLYTDVLNDLLSVRENAPQVCNAEPDDCGPGLRCNATDGACVEATVDPDPEPTGECVGAERPESINVANGTDGGKVCAGRDSWFGIDLREGDKVEVIVTFPHSEGDIDITVHDMAGKRLGSSAGTSDMESISFTAATTGVYRLRVFGYSGAENEVTINVNVAGQSNTNTCPDEASEPNNNSASASPLAVGTHEGALCGSDSDFYAITSTGAWTVTVAFDHATGDLDLKATDANGKQIGLSQGTTDTETISGTGAAFIQVYGYNGAQGSYSVTLE